MATKPKASPAIDQFAELCAAFPLRPIRDDARQEAAEAIAHAILRKSSTTQDEEDYSVSSISEMATGRRGIGAKHAILLGNHFSISPAAFLGPRAKTAPRHAKAKGSPE